VNKRYLDIFEQSIYRGEKTPLSVGTLVVFALCFLLLICATFTQITFPYPFLEQNPTGGIHFVFKNIVYNPQIPIMLFIIYLLGKKYSCLLFFTYLIVGFFVWPIFVFGKGFEIFQSYLFGYFLGFGVAAFIAGAIFGLNHLLKTRIIAAIVTILSIHIIGMFYCFILAVFKVIDFSLLFPIITAVSGSKIVNDVLFALIITLIAPYVKNIFWIVMKPKLDKNKLKNIYKRSQIIRDNID